ncbi:MAG: cell division protein ZapB [Desulfuromonadaceae bacterium]|nr:cell division protein ZapB [Desulfuromonadaceae bacterium]MDD2856704.1 cell division protein ZapB [Desulfuromonadaceae bacterium]
MLFSRNEKSARKGAKYSAELCDFSQLGLDFVSATSYSVQPRKEMETMNQELIEVLENKINELLGKYNSLKEENAMLSEEVDRLSNDREGIKSRVDSILARLDGI